MDSYNIYQDIATRTGGDIYIGVVGPVRTGKSTFIKRFMDLLVLPNIENAFRRERAKDELPQSAAGKTIMTTEPKFIPNEAVEISLSDSAKFKVRMIDCVGYIVDSALGHIENDIPRMVKTPWSEQEIPFAQAAEIGTKKVISDHSTIGLVITTDGSFTDIPREDYIESENRVISELKALGKPFIVLLNSASPGSEEANAICRDIKNRHGATVLPVNCQELEGDDISHIIESMLFEFPLTEIAIQIPDWVEVLSCDHWLKASIYDKVLSSIQKVSKIREAKQLSEQIGECEQVQSVEISEINLGAGTVSMRVSADDDLFYRILGEASGFEIQGKETLLSLMTNLAQIKKSYDKVSYALKEVETTGYGIVSPTIDELSLEEPEIVKQGNRFGVRLKASAPSIHMMCNKPGFLKTA